MRCNDESAPMTARTDGELRTMQKLPPFGSSTNANAISGSGELQENVKVPPLSSPATAEAFGGGGGGEAEAGAKVTPFSSVASLEAVCCGAEIETSVKAPPLAFPASPDADGGDLESKKNIKMPPCSSPATPNVDGGGGETEINAKLPPCASSPTPNADGGLRDAEMSIKMPPCSSSANPNVDCGEVEGKGEEELDRVLESQGRVVVVVVDVGSSEEDDKKEVETVCRICHLGSDLRGFGGGHELLHIGCACKGDLGCAHRHCAEAWFRVKGNRFCEICGVNAKNVSGEGYMSFIESWHEIRMLRSNNRNLSEQSSCWSGQPCCNFLMACLVIAFIIPWFFRVNIFD